MSSSERARGRVFKDNTSTQSQCARGLRYVRVTTGPYVENKISPQTGIGLVNNKVTNLWNSPILWDAAVYGCVVKSMIFC